MTTCDFKITCPIEEVWTFPLNESSKIRLEISDNNCINTVASQFNTTNITVLFSNNTLTQKVRTDGPNEISPCFTLLEDNWKAGLNWFIPWTTHKFTDKLMFSF